MMRSRFLPERSMRGELERMFLRAALASVVVLIATSAEVARAQLNPARFDAYIDQGSFAAALSVARGAGSSKATDAMLSRVALAQARAGLAGPAWQTATEISSEGLRSQTTGQLPEAPPGGPGGGVEPDFDALIELITTTVAPTTWEEVGGPGSIAPFETGVRIDPAGLLKPETRGAAAARLAALRAASRPVAAGVRVVANDDARRPSPLRKISLPRLEREIARLLASGSDPTQAMCVLAGLQRIQYVFVYPESGDLVIAGPAGDWQLSAEGRIVSAETGLPVVRLDDLLVVFRETLGQDDAKLGCMITPTQEGLARVKAFVEESNRAPIKPSERGAWLERLKTELGQQGIEIYGVDPRTRVARVMVEADYRMKLVGLGIDESVPGLASYLASIRLGPNDPPPPMGVLRWWFTLNYDAIVASADHTAYALEGQGVQVLSENERLTAEGKRIHTGQSDALNTRFARGFTRHFNELCRKYPIYAELRNIGDLAMAAAIVRSADLSQRAGWQTGCFADRAALAVGLMPAPRKVDTVANLRVVNRGLILAAVSGGVRIDPSPLVSEGALKPDQKGKLASQRAASGENRPADRWWWD